MALAQFAPMIAGWLGGSKAQDIAFDPGRARRSDRRIVDGSRRK
jgi:hypothetical protein